MAIRFTYATEPCTRCGGSGSYSRCQMFGTDCFKCVAMGNPRGIQSTKDAVEARTAMTAFRDALLSVDASTLAVGDVINATSARGGTARHGKACQLTIREIAAPHITCISGEAAARMTASGLSFQAMAAAVDAGEIPGTVSRSFNVRGDKATIAVAVGSKVQRMPNADDVAKIVAFARTLAGVTVVES